MYIRKAIVKGMPILAPLGMMTGQISGAAATPQPVNGRQAYSTLYAPLLSSTACSNWSFANGQFPAPLARQHRQIDRYHGKKISDPYRALEYPGLPETRAWVMAQNVRTQSFIGPLDPVRAETMAALRQANNYAANGSPQESGKYIITYHRNGTLQQPQIMVQEKDGTGPERVLLDINSLSPDHTVSLALFSPHSKGLAAYGLSNQGSDEVTLRIRDIATGRDLPDVIPDTRFLKLMWDHDGKGFVYQTPETPDSPKMVIKHHRLGDRIENDPVVIRKDDAQNPEFTLLYTGAEQFVYGNGEMYRRVPGSNQFQTFKSGFFGPVTKIDGRVYGIIRDGIGTGRLAHIDPENPDKGWTTLIPENKNRKLAQIYFHHDHFFVNSIENMSSRIDVYSKNGEFVRTLPLPANAIFSMASALSDGSLFIEGTRLTERLGIYKYDAPRNSLSLHRASPNIIDPAGIVTERLTARSKDGTLIPYTVVRPRHVRLDGTAAVNLYSYGGFGNDLAEYFDYPPLNWVRAGGIYVHAHLRGGSEFGSDWHQKGSGANKQNTFDDLAAVAKELIRDGYTTPQRLMINGASNGGLTVLATAQQNPELFGAVIASVPVADLFRFDQHHPGYYWRSEYGDPRKKDEFNRLARMSPLHNIKKDRHYPATLVMTAENDDRVVPMHSYKFIATFQAKAAPSSLGFLYVQSRAGHGAGQSLEQRYSNVAIAHSFASRAIGPIDQDDYRLFRQEQRRAAQTSREVRSCNPN